MEQIGRARERLRNIRSVQPILGAMRTIALGSRAQALNRKRYLEEFKGELAALIALARQHGLKRGGATYRLVEQAADKSGGAATVLVVGTQRGFCGAFNESLASFAAGEIEALLAAGCQVTVLLQGTRVDRILRPSLRSLSRVVSISGASLPTWDAADALVGRWLADYDSHKLDSVDIIAQTYAGVARYSPTTTRVLPPDFGSERASTALWPPIVETDPMGILDQALRLWMTASVYGILLESALAEHSQRFQLMDGATQNAAKAVDELQLHVQMARQQAITSELQDLMSGAGLLGPQVD